VRLGYGGVAAMPSRAKKTEAALIGKKWSAETIQSVLPVCGRSSRPFLMCAASQNIARTNHEFT